MRGRKGAVAVQRGLGIVGQPMTYRRPDGKQYVWQAVRGYTVARWARAGAIASTNLATRDDTTGKRVGTALRNLKNDSQAGGTLDVVALP
jgi:lanthanide-dependent methanol dehydrogenase